MKRLGLLVTLLLARLALADWWNVGPGPAPPPVNNPKCVSGCDDAPSSQPQNSNRNTRDPEAEARQRAADEAARQEAERRAAEAQREFEAVRDATQRLGEVGSSTREQARRFDDYRDQLERRETLVRSLERALAPVGADVVKPAAGARTAVSMKEYCDRLNAAAPAGRTLRVSDVPLPSAQSSVRTAAFEAPPSIPPGRFTEVTAAINRAREALKVEAKETADSLGWKYLGEHVPYLTSAKDLFDSGKQNYEALSGLTTRLANAAFAHAHEVALTVGGAGGTATREDNDRITQSMGRDVNDTSATLLAEQARGAIKESLLDKVFGWFAPGEDP
ncbi:MAG: hypothetical protein Q8L48_16330 [Archangium sp.]|nr:hypothetical protein [Archangium sp.]